MTDLKSSWKNKEKELKDADRTQLVQNNFEIRLLKNDVSQFERGKTTTTQHIAKFEGTMSKGQATLTEVRALYAASRRSIWKT